MMRRQNGDEGFPSRRALRLGLLIAVPAALCVGSMAPSWAQSLRRWANGDTLEADALNANFELLGARIDALAAAPLTLDAADARYDDFRWALLHAAAVGACAGSPSTGGLAVAQTLPRPPDRDCTDVCEEALVASGVTLPRGGLSACITAISIGQISTERARGSVSVGHAYRYPCGGELAPLSNAPAEPLAFDESLVDAAEPPDVDVRERLIGGYAQYCCCGSAFVPFEPPPPDDGSGG